MKKEKEQSMQVDGQQHMLALEPGTYSPVSLRRHLAAVICPHDSAPVQGGRLVSRSGEER